MQFYLRLLKSDGKVLMFHQVNSNKIIWKEPNISISVETFEQLLKTMNKQYIATTPDMLENAMFDKKLLITFDDAFDDVYYNAFPILKRLEIPFTIFVTYSFIDKKGYLTRGMVEELNQSKLCTWGYHTLNHKVMRKLSEREMFEEIDQGRTLLEEFLNKKIDYFAFPYGSCWAVSKKNINYVREKDFKLLFTTWSSDFNIRNIGKRRLVPRINVNERTARKYIDGTFG